MGPSVPFCFLGSPPNRVNPSKGPLFLPGSLGNWEIVHVKSKENAKCEGILHHVVIFPEIALMDPARHELASSALGVGDGALGERC